MANALLLKELPIEVNQGEIVGLLWSQWCWQNNNILYDSWSYSTLYGTCFLDEKDITDMPMYKRAKRV